MAQGDPLAEGVIEVTADIAPLEQQLQSAEAKVAQSASSMEKTAVVDVSAKGGGEKKESAPSTSSLEKGLESQLGLLDKVTKAGEIAAAQEKAQAQAKAQVAVATTQVSTALTIQEENIIKVVAALEGLLFAQKQQQMFYQQILTDQKQEEIQLKLTSEAIAQKTAVQQAANAAAQAEAAQAAAQTAASNVKVTGIKRLIEAFKSVNSGILGFGRGLKGILQPIRVASGAVMSLAGTVAMVTGGITLLIGAVTWVIDKLNAKAKAAQEAQKALNELAKARDELMKQPLVPNENVDKERENIKKLADDKRKALKENYEEQNKNMKELGASEQARQSNYLTWLKDNEKVNAEELAAQRELTKKRAADTEKKNQANRDKIARENERMQIGLITDDKERIAKELEFDLRDLEEKIANEKDAKSKSLLKQQLIMRVKQSEAALKEIEKKEKDAADQQSKLDQQLAEERLKQAKQYAAEVKKTMQEMKMNINALLNLDQIEVGMGVITGLLQTIVNKTRSVSP